MHKTLSVLIIEDDKYARLNLIEIMAPFGLVAQAESLADARLRLAEQTYDMVITDLDLGDGTGMDLIGIIAKRGSHCIVVSSRDEEEVIERAYSLGATHFLSKFKIRDQLPVYVKKYLLSSESVLDKFLSEHFVTQDPELIRDLRRLCEINWKDQTLFISGPTGTGKTLLGRLVHDVSQPEGELVHLNCSEVSENLLESELFGHEKGAFTGAESKKDGKLKLAHGGTLFLDEVATMPLSMQQKLLKALDEKTFYPVGSTAPVRSNFTLITATCEDLKLKVARKEFREDLYYRISGFSFHLRALTDRRGDIDLLLRHYQRRAPRRFVIRPGAMEYLRAYPWPGNVRELRKTCERFSQAQSGVIDLEEVRSMLSAPTQTTIIDPTWADAVRNLGLRAYIHEIERRAVEESLRRNNGKVTACIKELRISSSAFYRILQEHQLSF